MRSDQLRVVRRERLRVLVKEFKTVAEVARRSGVSEKYLSQVINEVVQQRGKSARSLGDTSAAKLEAGCGKPTGWMDIPTDALFAAGFVPDDGPAHSPPAPHGKVVPWVVPSDLSDDWVLVERRSIKLAAGNGTVVFEHEKLPPLAFRSEYLREKRVRSNNNLVICYAEGDSMEPSFRDRDVLLCDTGQTEIIDGEVYALDYGGELRVKRLRKRFDGGLLIQSDNAARFPPEVLTATDSVHIKILGRVLWRGGSV